MDKRVVSFRRGDENRVVIEKNDKNALFSIQYRIADNILKRIRKAQDLSSDQIFSMVNNTIACCRIKTPYRKRSSWHLIL